MVSQTTHLKTKVLLSQIIISAAFTVVLLYPNLFAYWGIIDDHEIIVNLGPDNEMSLSEIPSRLMESEAGLAKEGRARYRPAYWIINLTETALWDGDPLPWYGFRMLLIGTSVFLAWRLLSKLFGTVFSGISCLFLFTQFYWADIGARLGPAELYALFGLSLYCYCFYRIWKGGKDIWWAPLSLGAFIAYGSKENFLFLVPITAVLLYKRWKDNRLSLAAVSSGVFVTITGCVVAGVVLFFLSRTGADIYGNSISPVERLVSRLFAPYSLMASIPFLASALLFAASKRLPEPCWAPFRYKTLFLIQLLLFTLWISQFFFYSGALPTGTRYDFPGMFIYGLSFLFLFYMVFKAIGRTAAARGAILAAFAAFVVFVQAWNGFLAIHEVSLKNMQKTRAFSRHMTRVASILKDEPATPLILESHTFGDFEPVVSVPRYLLYYGVENTVAVYFKERVMPRDKGPLSVMLVKMFQEFQNGDKSVPSGRLMFSPYRSLPDGKCFVLTFSGDSTLNCTDLGRIW